MAVVKKHRPWPSCWRCHHVFTAREGASAEIWHREIVKKYDKRLRKEYETDEVVISPLCSACYSEFQLWRGQYTGRTCKNCMHCSVTADQCGFHHCDIMDLKLSSDDYNGVGGGGLPRMSVLQQAVLEGSE